MIPFETLTELFEIATAPYSRAPWACAAAPTAHSVDRIQRDLGVRLPGDLVHVAAACPCVDAQIAEPHGAPFQSFREYAEHFALHHAPRVHDKALRRRTKRLIQELGAKP